MVIQSLFSFRQCVVKLCNSVLYSVTMLVLCVFSHSRINAFPFFSHFSFSFFSHLLLIITFFLEILSTFLWSHVVASAVHRTKQQQYMCHFQCELYSSLVVPPCKEYLLVYITKGTRRWVYSATQ